MKKIFVEYDLYGKIANVTDNSIYFEQENESISVCAEINTTYSVRAYIKASNNNSTVTDPIIKTDEGYVLTINEKYMSKGTLYIGFEVFDESGYIERYEPLKIYIDSFVNLGEGVSDNVYVVTAKINQVKTLDAGENAYVENIGTAKDLLLNIGIPRGMQGVQGEQGLQGEKGPKGDKGDNAPVRGADYWTEDDKAEITADIKDILPGEKTPEHGEVFNDYGSNKAISPHTHSEGNQTTAGGKAFRITKYESNVNNTAYDCITINGANLLSSEWAVNDECIIGLSSTDATSVTNTSKITSIVSDTELLIEHIDLDGISGSFVPSADYYTFTIRVIEKYNIQGDNVIEFGGASHAEGIRTIAVGYSAHSEGHETQALHNYTHAEGTSTKAIGETSHAEGSNTIALGFRSHSEGYYTKANGEGSHTEGYYTKADSDFSHTEGKSTIAGGKAFRITGHTHEYDERYAWDALTIEGAKLKSSGWSQGDICFIKFNNRYYSKIISVISDTMLVIERIELKDIDLQTLGSTDEDSCTICVPGKNNLIGTDIVDLGISSHAEGELTSASGDYSHAEGYQTKAGSKYAHTEGKSTIAGYASHAEGNGTKALNNYTHSEGSSTQALGETSHAEGSNTITKGLRSHAEGYYTIAYGDHSHVQGKYNIEDTENKYAHIVGNGISSKRSNAHTLDWEGNAWFAGDVQFEYNGHTYSMITILEKLISDGIDIPYVK